MNKYLPIALGAISAIIVGVLLNMLYFKSVQKQVQPFSFVSAAMKYCPNNGAVPDNIAFTVRVIIGSNFSNALVVPPVGNLPVRDVYYQPGATGTASDMPNQGVPLPAPNNDGSLFNLDLTQLPLGNGNGTQAYARIRVLLQDTGEYSFYTETLPGGPTIRGVADGGVIAGTANVQSYQCIADPSKDTDTNNPPMPLAQFYVPIYSRPVANGTVTRSFNIGLVPKGMPTTPILIDPKHFNNG